MKTPNEPSSRQNHIALTGTKIVATLGPATNSAESIGRVLAAGVDVVRLNFSHGTLEKHAETLAIVRETARSIGRPVAVMGDLCGPKIRLGIVRDGTFDIAPGEMLTIDGASEAGEARRVGLNQPDILGDIATGHRVLIDDGAIHLRVEESGTDRLVCRCEVGGTLRSHKGVNLPDSDIRLSTITDKDIEDMRWAAEAELDYLALSFVRRADDVIALRDLLSRSNSSMHIVSKIETPQAVENIEAIIETSNAILIARGDLGVEMDVARVPRIQKDICDLCREAGKPVIVATQMLQSMIEAPVPTRAEVSDVANAIVDGADAVMLSGETAVGKYPTEAVAILQRVAADTEAYDEQWRRLVDVNKNCPGVTSAVAHSMGLIAEELNARVLAVWTQKGDTARLLSKHRPKMPVVAMAPTDAVCRRLALFYGVSAVCAGRPERTREQVAAVGDAVRTGGWANPGDLVVIGLGPRILKQGSTASIVIHLVPAGSAE